MADVCSARSASFATLTNLGASSAFGFTSNPQRQPPPARNRSSPAKPRSPARALNSMTPPTVGVKSGITDVAAVLSQYSAASGPASSLVTRRPDRHPAAASGLAGVFGNSRKLSAWLSCFTGALPAASNVTGSFSERQDSTSGSAANRVPTTHVALTDLTADVESAESASTFREAPRVVAPPASSPGEATAAVDTPGSGAATPGPSQSSMELVAHPAGGSGGQRQRQCAAPDARMPAAKRKADVLRADHADASVMATPSSRRVAASGSCADTSAATTGGDPAPFAGVPLLVQSEKLKREGIRLRNPFKKTRTLMHFFAQPSTNAKG